MPNNSQTISNKPLTTVSVQGESVYKSKLRNTQGPNHSNYTITSHPGTVLVRFDFQSVAIKPRCATHRLVMILQCPGPSRLADSHLRSVESSKSRTSSFTVHTFLHTLDSGKLPEQNERVLGEKYRSIPLPSTIKWIQIAN